MKLNCYILGCTLVAALGSFIFGFDAVVISGTEQSLFKIFSLTNEQWGRTVTSAVLGTILGSLLVGWPAERFGRKNTLVMLAVLYFVAALGCALAWNWGALLAFRFMIGLAIGASSVVSPMYIAEISPPRVRGSLVAVTQLNIVIGILAAFCSNYLIVQFLGYQDPMTWRWMLGIAAAPSALLLLLLLFIPESPRWLVKQHRHEEALKILQRVGNEDAAQVLAEIVESLHEERVAASERFFQPKYRMPILLAITIAAFNQFSGINAVMFYTPRIFRMAGAGSDSAFLQSMAVGLTLAVFTVLAMTIIDRFGRRKLMIAGSLGYIVSMGTMAWAFNSFGTNFTPAGGVVVLISMLVFIASHAFGQGAVIWVFLSEIFPNRVRARGLALGCFTHWVMASVVSWTFPIFGDGMFAFFAAMMVLQLIWVLRVMPETKGVPLEQIQRKLGIE